MGLARVGQISVILAAPALVLGAALHLPRLVGVVSRVIRETRGLPTGPPIERLAADLRRLMHEHDVVHRSAAAPMRIHHLGALEGAIGDCARQAARALGLPRPAGGSLPTPELRRLLRSLADAGLVLPSGAGLLRAD